MTEHTRRVAILIGWVGVLIAAIALKATNAGSSVASGVAWGVGYLGFLATLFAGSLLFDRHRRKRS
jgi:hypothetical protein